MQNYIKCNLKTSKCLEKKNKISLEKNWYSDSLNGLTIFLLPFSWLFRSIVAVRYFLYQKNIKKKINFPVPVIVVGNLTVGGTGKTPFVIWLADILQKAGYRPGIVSRGVGGEKFYQPYSVDKNADPKLVGDEALLLVERTQCPMMICVNRVLAVQALLQKTPCNIVISDDGLQHYRMGRNIEIVIVDGVRKFGNQQMLPAGPLREPLTRLQQVDLMVTNGANKFLSAETMQLQGDVLYSLLLANEQCSLAHFKDKKVHAVAGIGHPERFFAFLREHQIQVIEHIFPDHYLYQESDLKFSDEFPVVMTEKDAVKCRKFAKENYWYLPVRAEVSEGVKDKIFSLLLKNPVIPAKAGTHCD